MSFNTAFFYDIENLLKGYDFSNQMLLNFSLEEIVAAVKQTERIGQIAVQRAYANWSDSRLAIMRGEINELGIDPIQVFGFSWDQKKNAADIQLAIDAIDLAHVRPALQVFVIVSGDGGFASLAKKLHEYGKTVIGCGYRNCSSKTFQAVCDTFVWIADPEEEDRSDRRTATTSPVAQIAIGVSDPRNVRLVLKISKSQPSTVEEVFQKVREVLRWYASDSDCRADLSSTGMYLNVVQEAVKAVIPGFQAVQFGFPKFIEFMQHACVGNSICVARPPHSQAVLKLRSAVRASDEVLPDLERRNLRTADGYRSLLSNGMPIMRLPTPAELHSILVWIAEHPPVQADLGSLIEAATIGIGGAVASEAVKLGLLSLTSADVFDRDPEVGSLSDQRLTLRAGMSSAEALRLKLRSAASNKLQSALGEVDEEILDQLFGNPTEPAGIESPPEVL